LAVARNDLAAEYWRLFSRLSTKSQKICANDAARAILQNSGAMAKQLSPHARLYIHDFRAKFFERAPRPIYATLLDEPEAVAAAPRSLEVAGVSLRTLADLEQLAPYLVRQRPALKAAGAYLTGADVGTNGKPIDVHFLEDVLTKAWPRERSLLAAAPNSVAVSAIL
jgi:hypothetical protein